MFEQGRLMTDGKPCSQLDGKYADVSQAEHSD